MIVMELSSSDTARKIGRPLSFDRQAALQKAMLTFWQFGYETTTIADLTVAMGVTAPSIYAAYGDKKALFLEALQLYAGDPTATEAMIDTAPTAKVAANDMLISAANAFTDDNNPRGCLLASATASGSSASADVRAAVADIRSQIAMFLERRIQRDIDAGILSATADAHSLSLLVISVIQGMSVLARDGVPKKVVVAVAEQALGGWPD
jgi:AcrR family transcriptional regulator